MTGGEQSFMNRRMLPRQLKINSAILRKLRLNGATRNRGRLIYISSDLRRQLLVEFLADGRSSDQTPTTLGSVVLVGDGGVVSVELGEAIGICAEAPLPRVLIRQQNIQLDGVGGMASILKLSNVSSIVFCPFGRGTTSSLQRRLLGKEQLVYSPLHSCRQRKLQHTRHVIAGSHHIAHLVNQEVIAAESVRMETRSIYALQQALKRAGFLCIIDREDGGFDSRPIEAVLASAKELQVPIIYDSKSENLVCNKAIDIIKVNQDQVRRWFGITDDSDEASLRVAELVRERSGAKCVVYTRRTQGILISGAGRKNDPAILIRPHKRELFDLVSVGDIVTTALVFCLTRKCSILHAVCFAASAAEFSLDRRYDKHFDLRTINR